MHLVNVIVHGYLDPRLADKVIQLLEETRRDNPVLRDRVDFEAETMGRAANTQSVLNAITERVPFRTESCGLIHSLSLKRQLRRSYFIKSADKLALAQGLPGFDRTLTALRYSPELKCSDAIGLPP